MNQLVARRAVCSLGRNVSVVNERSNSCGDCVRVVRSGASDLHGAVLYGA